MFAEKLARKRVQYLTFNGRTQSLSAWAKEFGRSRDTIKKRLQLGWDVETALTQTADDSLRIQRWARHDARIQVHEQTKPEIRLYAPTYEESLAQLIREDFENQLGLERECIVGTFTQDEGHWSDSSEGSPWCGACGSFDLQQFSNEGRFRCEKCSKLFEDVWGCLNCTRVVCDDCLTTRTSNVAEHTLRTIGTELNVGRERVRQIELAAERKVRGKLQVFATDEIIAPELSRIHAAHRRNERASSQVLTVAQQEAHSVHNRVRNLLSASVFQFEVKTRITSHDAVKITCHTNWAFERAARVVGRRLGDAYSFVAVYLIPPADWLPPCERDRRAELAKAAKEKEAAEKKAAEEQRLKDWIERARAAQGADYREGQVPLTITEYWHAYGVGEDTVVRRMHPDDKWCPSHLLRLERPGLKLFMVVHSIMVVNRYFQGGATKRIHLFRATEWRGPVTWHTADWRTLDDAPSEWTMHIDPVATSLRNNRPHHGWQKWSVTAINPQKGTES